MSILRLPDDLCARIFCEFAVRAADEDEARAFAVRPRTPMPLVCRQWRRAYTKPRTVLCISLCRRGGGAEGDEPAYTHRIAWREYLSALAVPRAYWNEGRVIHLGSPQQKPPPNATIADGEAFPTVATPGFTYADVNAAHDLHASQAGSAGALASCMEALSALDLARHVRFVGVYLPLPCACSLILVGRKQDDNYLTPTRTLARLEAALSPSLAPALHNVHVRVEAVATPRDLAAVRTNLSYLDDVTVVTMRAQQSRFRCLWVPLLMTPIAERGRRAATRLHKLRIEHTFSEAERVVMQATDAYREEYPYRIVPYVQTWKWALALAAGACNSAPELRSPWSLVGMDANTRRWLCERKKKEVIVRRVQLHLGGIDDPDYLSECIALLPKGSATLAPGA